MDHITLPYPEAVACVFSGLLCNWNLARVEQTESRQPQQQLRLINISFGKSEEAGAADVGST